MTIRPDWLTDPGAQSVMRMLSDAGHEALFVGGCVRNALLGVAATDIDIATDALPERVMELAVDAGFHAVPTGIEHGTVTVIREHTPFEVTTYRQDVRTDGRRAVVAFTGDVAADAARRDFTMNALYLTAEGSLIDPLGGYRDIEARKVRFIGAARDRIAEDYLRILRFFRFHAWYGEGPLDEAGLKACADMADGLSGLSAERITAETIKILSAPDPSDVLRAMESAGVLARILPGADLRLLPFLIAAEAAPDWLARILMIGATEDRLRLSRAQSRALRDARGALSTGAGTAERAYRLGADTARRCALVEAAILRRLPAPSLEAEIARGASAAFPVAAADLMAFVEPGPALGAALGAIEADWIASDFRLDRDTLLARWRERA
ncbi:MAG: CCA tRNA nucleotidyltransferase [Rubricella sp.]